MAQQEIIIDFVVDDSGIDTALGQLEKMGVIDKQVATAFKSTTAEINKQAAAIKNTSLASCRAFSRAVFASARAFSSARFCSSRRLSALVP